MVQTQLYFKEKNWCGFSEFSLSSLGIWPQSYQVNWASLSSPYQSCSAAIRWELGLGRSPSLLRGFSSLVFMHCSEDYLMQPRECFQGLDNAMRSHLVWFLWFLYNQCRCGPLHSPKTCSYPTRACGFLLISSSCPAVFPHRTDREPCLHSFAQLQWAPCCQPTLLQILRLLGEAEMALGTGALKMNITQKAFPDNLVFTLSQMTQLEQNCQQMLLLKALHQEWTADWYICS